MGKTIAYDKAFEFAVVIVKFCTDLKEVNKEFDLAR